MDHEAQSDNTSRSNTCHFCDSMWHGTGATWRKRKKMCNLEHGGKTATNTY